MCYALGTDDMAVGKQPMKVAALTVENFRGIKSGRVVFCDHTVLVGPNNSGSINGREIRFSVGAVNGRTGNFTYFDHAEMTIRPEHVMASGALPPGFPAVEIDGECYWDGGLVSNTPLQYVLECVPRRSRLTFQVDLFHARGRQPTDLEEVREREMDSRYSSRTRAITDLFRTLHDVRHNINSLWDQLPESLRRTPEAKFLYDFGCVTTMDVVELIYRPTEAQGHSKDYEFSRTTMRTRWAQGLSDAQATLLASPSLAPMPPKLGARTFDVLKDIPPHEPRRPACAASAARSRTGHSCKPRLWSS